METLVKEKKQVQAAQPVEITEKELADRLILYAKERHKALSIYPSLKTAPKMDAAIEIIAMLNEAKRCDHPRDCIKMILKTALDFHFIAPTKTRKLHRSWYDKIEACMEGCRQYLGWKRQSMQ